MGFNLKVKLEWRIKAPRDSENSINRARRRRAERAAMQRVLAPHRAPDIVGWPPGSVVVTFVRHAHHQLDDDSLSYAYKSMRDQLALWCGVKDGPKDPISWRYKQRKYTEVEINPRAGRTRYEGPTRYVQFTMVSITVRKYEASDKCMEVHGERTEEVSTGLDMCGDVGPLPVVGT